MSALETVSQICLLIESVFIGYIGYGHLFKPDGNLAELGFTYRPRWEETKERALLMRHLCACLGAAHVGRGAAGVFAGVRGGIVVIYLLFGEIVFLLSTVYAYSTFPSGTGAKGSPKNGPVEVMYALLALSSIGFVAGLLAQSARARRTKHHLL
mmetsp:Transcript_16718/g.24570  ORF Transcript_16718/g.24570 Transcript_16718/m.24570 type:complete len:154 (+) Transcript_16718:235-696(+)